MFNPNTMTVADAASTLRDIGILTGLVISGWKARSWFQPIVEFFKRANNFFTLGEHHMMRMEKNMDTLLTNHLSHIESDLKRISGRETGHVAALQETDISDILAFPDVPRAED